MDAPDDELTGKLPSSVHENLGVIADFHERKKEQLSPAQAFFERVSLMLGTPAYVAANLVFAVCWIAWNLVAPNLDFPQLDEPPFFWLQGLIGLNAFIISTAVLIRQNRMSRLANHHAHLDLQVSLLADEKTSKIIQMLEELRRDLPGVQDKPDREADELARRTDTKAVISVIEREADGLDSERK
ncbi:DUF1003 domain-containing protein [Massilia sp. DD77]|uniref:DUF1003 domain-containing protein n=1 Tax=Massilia sp. DD77 TaxID=3109349 RepID=UPI002FFF56E7